MFKKGSKLYSILTGSCPKCHQESMYSNKNPYHLSEVLHINEKCSHCKTKYRIEPSFFYGAMYVSYAVNVALGVATFVCVFFLMVTEGLSPRVTVTSSIFSMLSTMLINSITSVISILIPQWSLLYRYL